ncbi:MAG: GNAT family N-acetyltransferase [Pseudanabaenaceae cyanobacterium bins.68]|nr:GNAT family N-acetyltransferase [Pseudanabaenaceae cyanobacterium bins.68]
MIVLASDRLWLKPVQLDQFEQFYQILTDQYVRHYLCDQKVIPRSEAMAMLHQSLELFAQFGFGIWGLELKTCGSVIGFAGLWYFFGEPQPQLIYALLPAWTRQGLATEAAQAVINYSFDLLGFAYLVASCDRANLDSARLAQRLGMTFTAERLIEQQPIKFFTIHRSN